MCGIAGFVIKPGMVTTKKLRKLRNVLTIAMEPRGHMATGWAMWNPLSQGDNRKVYYTKDALKATDFVEQNDANPQSVGSMMLIHTRFATTGSPQVNDNNHPIIAGNTVGIHNGMLTSHKIDAKNLNLADKLEYEVDSELLFRFIESKKVNADGECVTDDSYYSFRKEWTKIDGDASIAWIDCDTSLLHMASLGGRPYWLADAYVRGAKVGVVFASTKEALVLANSVGGFYLADFRELPVGKELVYNDQGQLVGNYEVKRLREVYNRNYAAANGRGSKTAKTQTAGYYNGYSAWDSWDEYYAGFDFETGEVKTKPKADIRVVERDGSTMDSLYQHFLDVNKIPTDMYFFMSSIIERMVANGYTIHTVPDTSYTWANGLFTFNNDDAEQFNFGYSRSYGQYMMQTNYGRTIAYFPRSLVETEFQLHMELFDAQEAEKRAEQANTNNTEDLTVN